jgi:hypothetical protein
MNRSFKSLVQAAVAVSLSAVAPADSGAQNERVQTIAVFGDWPYSQSLLENAHWLINSVNEDRTVETVLHVGDIHSGSMPCTSAGIAFDYQTKSGSPIATANPSWNLDVFREFQQFNASLVYTPGDNEWADCHKPKQFASGAPLKELASIRELFFSHAGETLGNKRKRVISQARAFDTAHPEDSQFVENVLWKEGDVVFATFNMPGGSNNDTDTWTAPFADVAAQTEEAALRNAANLRWLIKAFERATYQQARAVVIALQADMWDLEGGAAHLSNYRPFVQTLANLSLQFGRPVLLLNGDSHNFKAEKPLATPTDALGSIHQTQAVPNLTRIVVEGSGVGRHWLRLTIDPSSKDVFTWYNVTY